LLPLLKWKDNTSEWVLKAMVEVNELRMHEYPAKRRRSMKMHSCYVVIKEEKGLADKKNHAKPDIQNQPDKDTNMRWD